jgi:hypothetical protein
MRGAMSVLVVSVLAVLVLGASAALAAKPTFTRIDVADSGPDPFFTEACGFPVTSSAEGHVTIREFDLADDGLARVLSISVAVTVSANGNEVTFHDVGADLARVAPDGTVIVSIIGIVPGGFTGVLKFNAETEETILEPQHSLEGQTEAICEALAA